MDLNMSSWASFTGGDRHRRQWRVAIPFAGLVCGISRTLASVAAADAAPVSISSDRDGDRLPIPALTLTTSLTTDNLKAAKIGTGDSLPPGGGSNRCSR